MELVPAPYTTFFKIGHGMMIDELECIKWNCYKDGDCFGAIMIQFAIDEIMTECRISGFTD